MPCKKVVPYNGQKYGQKGQNAHYYNENALTKSASTFTDTPSIISPSIFTLSSPTCSVTEPMSGSGTIVEGGGGGRVVDGTAMLSSLGSCPLDLQQHSLEVYHRAECTIGFGYGKAHYYHFS